MNTKNNMKSLFSLIIVLFLTYPATAREVKLGDKTFNVSPPTGFCELNPSNKFDASWLKSTTNLLNANGISTIAAYPDCNELKKARPSDAFITTKFIVSAHTAGIGRSSAQTTSQACDDLRIKDYTADNAAKVKKDVEEFSNGNSYADSKSLGVLDEVKGEVCYVGVLVKIKLKNGNLSTLLCVYAITTIKDDLLFLYHHTPYKDANSLPTALANLKIIYSEFAAANKS